MKNGGGYLFGIFDGHGGAACGQVDKKMRVICMKMICPFISVSALSIFLYIKFSLFFFGSELSNHIISREATTAYKALAVRPL